MINLDDKSKKGDKRDERMGKSDGECLRGFVC
jgi:hypothetical protein